MGGVSFELALLALLAGSVAAVPWDLESYKLCRRIALQGIPNEASGVTYSPVTNSLWVITRRPQAIVEYSVTGRKLRSLSHNGLRDPEGITWMHDYVYAISEERGPTITLVEAKPWRRAVKVIKRYDLRIIRSDRNKGLEGVTYDPASKSLFTCQEQDPMKVWQVFPTGKARQMLRSRTKFPMRDLSGMYYNPAGDNGLYILSQQTNIVMKYGWDGEAIGGRAVVEGRQPEGITFTPDGQLMIVVGEPNLMWFYTSTGKCSWDPKLSRHSPSSTQTLLDAADAHAGEPAVEIEDDVQYETGFVGVISVAYSGRIYRTPSPARKLFLRASIAAAAFDDQTALPHVLLNSAKSYPSKVLSWGLSEQDVVAEKEAAAGAVEEAAAVGDVNEKPAVSNDDERSGGDVVADEGGVAYMVGETLGGARGGRKLAQSSVNDDGLVLVVTYLLMAESEAHAENLMDKVETAVKKRAIQREMRRLSIPYWGDVAVVGRAVTPAGVPPADFPFYDDEEVSLQSGDDGIEVITVTEMEPFPWMIVVVGLAVGGGILIVAALLIFKRRHAYDSAHAPLTGHYDEQPTSCPGTPDFHDTRGGKKHPRGFGSPDLHSFTPWTSNRISAGRNSSSSGDGSCELSRFAAVGSPVSRFQRLNTSDDSPDDDYDEGEEERQCLSPTTDHRDHNCDDASYFDNRDAVISNVINLAEYESPLPAAVSEQTGGVTLRSHAVPSVLPHANDESPDHSCSSPPLDAGDGLLRTFSGNTPAEPPSLASNASRTSGAAPPRRSRLADLDSVSLDLDSRISGP